MSKKPNKEAFTSAMKEAGFTQSTLAEKVKKADGNYMDQPMLARILSGERELSLREAEQLRILLDISLSQLTKWLLG